MKKLLIIVVLLSMLPAYAQAGSLYGVSRPETEEEKILKKKVYDGYSKIRRHSKVGDFIERKMREKGWDKGRTVKTRDQRIREWKWEDAQKNSDKYKFDKY